MTGRGGPPPENNVYDQITKEEQQNRRTQESEGKKEEEKTQLGGINPAECRLATSLIESLDTPAYNAIISISVTLPTLYYKALRL